MKFLTNFFTNKDVTKENLKIDLQETVVAAFSEKEKETWYSEAHREAIRVSVRRAVEDALETYCLGEDVFEQTRAAIAEFGRFIKDEQKEEVLDKYPKARLSTDSYRDWEVTTGVTTWDIEKAITKNLLEIMERQDVQANSD